MKLAGAVVLVTGASSGIGRAAALAFDRAGARVAMAARREQRLADNAAQMRDALVLPTDLGDPAQAAEMVEKAVAHYGRLDVLVNNAAAGVVARADAIEPELLRRTLDANLVGHVVATCRAVPHMRRQGGGQIVNVSSPAGWLGAPLLAVYAASKAALSGWTRTLQAEWAGSEIAVSEYVPGLFATGMGAAAATSSQLAVGEVDVLAAPARHWILRRLARPHPPEKAAADLVALVRRPRLVMYSDPVIHAVTWLSQSPRLRRAMIRDMAVALRERLGLSMFSGNGGEPR